MFLPFLSFSVFAMLLWASRLVVSSLPWPLLLLISFCYVVAIKQATCLLQVALDVLGEQMLSASFFKLSASFSFGLSASFFLGYRLFQGLGFRA